MKIIIQDDEGHILREAIIDSEDVAAMETDMVDVCGWIENAVREKARRRVDHIVTMSGRGSKHTDTDTKRTIIASLKSAGHRLMERAVDRMAREDREREEKKKKR